MEEEENNNNRYSVPFQTPMTSLGSTVLILTDPKDDLYETELMFKGLVQQSDGKLVHIEGVEPMMTL